MPLPPNVATFTLTAEFPPLAPDGAERQGSFTFTPVPPVLVDASGVYLGVENATLDATGGFAKELVACDALDEPFVWRIDGDIEGMPPFSRNISVPASAGTVSLGTVAEFEALPDDYAVVLGPQGPQGEPGAEADAQTYTDEAIAAEAARADEAYDPAGAGAAAQSAAAATYRTLSTSARTDLGIYIPPGWGARWQSALATAQAGTGKATLATIGASSTQGYYSSNLRTKGWPGLLRTSLQATYGDGGDGYWTTSLSSVFQAANGIPAAAQSVYAAAGNLVSLTGSWSGGGSDYGPGAFYIFCSATATATWPSLRGTSISVFTIDGGSPARANWTYSIDGGPAVTVTDGGGASQTIRRTTISGLSPGTHSLTISYAGPSGYLSLCGVAAENSTGVVVNNLARYGSRAANFANVDQTLAAPWMAGPSYPADLTILAHGPNDAANSDSGDTWAKWQRRIMHTIRDTGAADGSADLMIVLPHIGRYDVGTWLYQDYAERALGLAHAYGAAFVNLWTLGRNSWNYWSSLGYWANSNNPGAAGSDSVHPSDAGYQHIANTLFPILTT